MAAFEGIDLNSTAGVDVPTGLNGGSGNIELGKTADFINDGMKVIVNDHGEFNLHGCIMYALWYELYKGDRTAARKNCDASTIAAAQEIIVQRIIQHDILQLFVHARMIIGIRVTDSIRLTEMNRVANFPELARTAKNVYNYILNPSNTAAHNLIDKNNKFVLFNLIGVHIHRVQYRGHTWYSGKTSDPNSVQYKICNLAGPDKSEFRTHMNSCGHDLWHFLQDDIMKDAVLAMAGCNDKMNPAHPYVANPTCLGYIYNNVDITGKSLKEVVNLPQEVTDRLPADELGKGAVAVGMEELLSFFSIIYMKLKIQGAEEMEALIQQLSRAFLENSFQRAELVQMKETLAPILVLAHGFAHGDAVSRVIEEDNTAIGALARRMTHENLHGRSLRTLVDSLKPAEETTASAVKSLILRVASCLNSTIETMNRNLADDKKLDPVELDAEEVIVKVAESNADKAAAAQAKMMESMMTRGMGRLAIGPDPAAAAMPSAPRLALPPSTTLSAAPARPAQVPVPGTT